MTEQPKKADIGPTKMMSAEECAKITAAVRAELAGKTQKRTPGPERHTLEHGISIPKGRCDTPKDYRRIIGPQYWGPQY